MGRTKGKAITATRRRGNHQTVLSAMMIPAGVRYRPRRRGQGGSPIVVVESWNYVCIDNFGVLPAAYPTTAARGRSRPTFIGTIIAVTIPWPHFLFSPILAPFEIFGYFFPFREYLRGAHFTGFSFRQCSNHARTCRTLHPPGTA